MTRLLIADDHPLVLTGIEAVLAESGYQIAGRASDGEQVLQQLATVKPEILVLDVRMPIRSGLDVLRILRSRGDERPIVLLTGSLRDQGLLEAMQLNVNGILMKEGAEDLLLACLDEVRHGRRWIQKSVLQRTVNLTLDPGGSLDPLRALTPRERTVAMLVGRGLRNREIGETLGLTEGTVKVVLHRVYEKLEIGNRTELALIAQEVGGGTIR